MGTVNSLIRTNVRELKPYSSARQEFKGRYGILLDANENPYGCGLNRYPDPFQGELRGKISRYSNVSGEKIFLGNGSDEVIDLLIRAFCDPGKDNIVGMVPGYGMYEVAASINNIEFRKVLLDENFGLDDAAVRMAADGNTKIVFLCSPNNPTGNLLDRNKITAVLNSVNALVVVDEAYIDFSGTCGMLKEIDSFSRLVVVRTLSKSWGRAGIRLGMAFASEDVVKTLNKIKPPYNISSLNMREACKTVGKRKRFYRYLNKIIKNRGILSEALARYPFVEKVYNSEANFILVKANNAKGLYKHLADNGIIVRDRSGEPGCANCLRITVGTGKENRKLIKALEKYKRK